jgi:hypothetical protein
VNGTKIEMLVTTKTDLKTRPMLKNNKRRTDKGMVSKKTEDNI